MTEAEFCDTTWGRYRHYLIQLPPRSVRLYSVACCRAMPAMPDIPQVREALDAAEAVADSGNPEARLQEHLSTLQRLRGVIPGDRMDLLCAMTSASDEMFADTAFEIELATREEKYYEPMTAVRRRQYLLLTCIGGVAFHPISFDPRWRSETVVALATGIYETRAFDRLPILADALEEAGCDHPDILSHCRGPGPHARGCWVVDLVLDKS